MRVLDPGPIPHANLERYDDCGLEAALEEDDIDPSDATYRLLEIPLTAIADRVLFSRGFWEERPDIRTLLERGESPPPIVVQRAHAGTGFMMIDGMNRARIYWSLGIPTIRAYELIVQE